MEFDTEDHKSCRFFILKICNVKHEFSTGPTVNFCGCLGMYVVLYAWIFYCFSPKASDCLSSCLHPVVRVVLKMTSDISQVFVGSLRYIVFVIYKAYIRYFSHVLGIYQVYIRHI